MITYPLNNIQYNAADAELYLSTRSSGVYSTNDFNLNIASSSSAQIGIQKGTAWIHNADFTGKVVAQKEQINLTLGLPNGIYNRYDVVAIEFDKIQNSTEIKIIQGTASSSPQIPSVTQTENKYQLFLYAILRVVGRNSVQQYDITDLRTDKKYCGIMVDTVNVEPSAIVDYIYPIGSIYMSANSTSPASFIGGTWVRIKDRFLLGAGDTYTNGATGGAATHTLTINEMPKHRHEGLEWGDIKFNELITIDNGTSAGILLEAKSGDVVDKDKDLMYTVYTGDSNPHNNMPPYLVVYMWKRTA